jgi:Tol biopolymer transport system component
MIGVEWSQMAHDAKRVCAWMVSAVLAYGSAAAAVVESQPTTQPAVSPTQPVMSVRCLTTRGAASPTFFPDGNHIAYVEETDDGDQWLRVVETASGKTLRVGTIDQVERPIVCADGKTIIYASGPPFARDIARVDVKTGKTKTLSGESAMRSLPMAMDRSTRVAWIDERDGRRILVTCVPSATSQPTTASAEEITSSGEIIFSPSGKRVAETVQDDKGVARIVVSDRTGKVIRTLRWTQPITSTTPPRGCYGPAFSPDEKYLAFVRSDIQPHADIWIVDLKTGDEIAITSDRCDNHSPVFSPDGKSLAFIAAKRGSMHQLYLAPTPTPSVPR